MVLTDVFAEGMQREGWQLIDGARLEKDLRLEADAVSIGTGAGGGVAADMLSQAGRSVILVEEGVLATSKDFQLREAESYSRFYQEGMTRTTQDGAISILQGRAVGGSTTVNWTSSFRTPEPTLRHWASDGDVTGLDIETLAPWFERMEQRLSIFPWELANPNNDILRRGCAALGWAHGAIPRNVKACWNLGVCGLGCPTNAKQSSLVTFIPDALRRGATLLHRVRAERLVFRGEQVDALEARAMDPTLRRASSVRITLRAPLYILAGGAIGTPALLLRSQAPDPYQVLGRRTFLHPSIFGFAQTADEVHPYHGAPQSIYSDHFQWLAGVTGPMGYKIEAAPLLPMFASVVMRGHGTEHWERMQALPHTAGALALLRDGFHPESSGGRVILRSDGSPTLDYPVNDYLLDGVKRAYLSLAELYFAGGAKAFHAAHGDSAVYYSWQEAKLAIQEFRYEKLRFRLGSAHVMGGCAMSDNPKRGVVNSQGRHHQIANVYVGDGSLFPSSIGANPQLSIFAIVGKVMQDLVSG